VDSSSESEPEPIVTAEEEEEEALKNAALNSINQDRSVDTLEEAAKKLDGEGLSRLLTRNKITLEKSHRKCLWHSFRLPS
jgi:phosphoribosylaminoimidazole-succinocarboxamide synthase